MRKTAWAAVALSAAVAAAPMEIDLRRPPDRGVSITTVGGEEALEWAGTRLAGGDINGDGIQDLVIAAPGGSEDRPSRRGRIYVVHGGLEPPIPRVDLTLRRRISVVPGEPPILTTGADVVIEGAGDFDHLGRSLAVADLDGDGFDDIIAGAPRADGPGDRRPDCGEVHVVHGGAALPLEIRLDAPPAGVRTRVVIGRSTGDLLGAAIALGDLDGDGRLDLAIGAPLASGRAGALGALDVGEVVVIPSVGRAPASLDLGDRAGATPRWVFDGIDAGDQAGWALAAGDFDGDGISDLAIGARGADGPGNQRPDAGEVYLVLGSRARGVGTTRLTADAIVLGAGIGDLAGSSLALGDFDGDGMQDLAIGADFADGRRDARLDAGEIRILAGRTRAALETLRPPPEPDSVPGPGVPAGPVQVDLRGAVAGARVLFGADPGDHTSVLAAADLDLDGKADLIAGAPDSSSRRNSRAGGGEARVVAGAAGWPVEADLVEAAALTIFGPDGNAHAGTAAAAVDLDGDGRPEVIVAGPQAGRAMPGRIWILRADFERLLRTSAPKERS